jgi:hypothetical protein
MGPLASSSALAALASLISDAFSACDQTGPHCGPVFCYTDRMPHGGNRISFMTKWIGATILVVTLMFGSSAAISRGAMMPLQATAQKPQASQTTDLSARRRVRHYYRYAYRGYDRPTYPTYYDRPYYYAPAPFVSFNFGYGLWPWW